MNISETIAEMKKNPEFAKNVGMILVHNGVVRAWSRKDRQPVESLEVTPDYEKIEAIRQDFLSPNQRCGLPSICSSKPDDSILSLLFLACVRLRLARLT